MAWPFSPLTTYVANSTPAIKAVDLNDIQSALVNVHNGLVGGIMLYDEFAGNAIDVTNDWIPTVSGSGSGQGIIDDNTFGASGCLQQVLGSSGGEARISTRLLNFGTNDFKCCIRVRNVTSNAYFMGVQSSTSGHGMFWQNTGFEWFAVTNGSAWDTGIAASASYMKFVIVRLSGVIYFFINGSLVYSEANTINLTDGYLTAALLNGSAGAAESRLDSISLWADR